MRLLVLSVSLLPALAAPILAGPDLECPDGSQIEIGNCVHETLERVDHAVASALDIARGSAAELDELTGRTEAVPALDASQIAWESYRNAQCDYVGASFGGGSGTGIGIESCRIVLGRLRAMDLLNLAN
ncbi:lysozyme inhibitor LprI family protein [Tropicimonas sp.]|uniref:lysozyme inhibitor LprI family protein n=1 Tax=Tropicimonas sp. TaxID=2067044 RepID=UPI003A844D8B